MFPKKKVSGRKAQLTMFFLLGILIIAAFSTIWYINSRSAEIQLQAPSEKLITDLLKTGTVPYYMKLCLEEQSARALELIGKQGGNIYVDQHGIAPNPTLFISIASDSKETNRVSYGVSAPPLANGTLHPYPPAYPGGMNMYSQVPDLKFDGVGMFGRRTLRRLCDTHGANSPFVFNTSRWQTYRPDDTETYHYTIADPICLYDNYEDTLSTQRQLERFVENTLQNCTNLTDISLLTGYNITQTDKPKIIFRLGLDDIHVDAYIPLRIEVTGGELLWTPKMRQGVKVETSSVEVRDLK